MAEAGYTEKEIMSVTGHKTSKEAACYTAAASQELLVAKSMAALGGAETAAEVSNLISWLDKNASNSLNKKNK